MDRSVAQNSTVVSGSGTGTAASGSASQESDAIPGSRRAAGVESSSAVESLTVQERTAPTESPTGTPSSAPSLSPAGRGAGGLARDGGTNEGGAAQTERSANPLAAGSISSGQIPQPVIKPGPAVSSPASGNGTANGVSKDTVAAAPHSAPAVPTIPGSTPVTIIAAVEGAGGIKPVASSEAAATISTTGTSSIVVVNESAAGAADGSPTDTLGLATALAVAQPGSMIITCENRVRTEEVHPIVIDDYPLATRTDLYVRLFEDGLGNPLVVPFVIVRGAEPGPVLGISAAVHGNELNGVKIIHRLLADVDPSSLRGALLCAPVVNIPAYNAGRREFTDGNDLNHVFPGKANGPPAEQYARAFVLTFLPAINYLIDIHTASEGRTNTLYVRADLLSEETQALALTTNPQIVLHAKGGDGTLRNAARQRNIPSVTMEVGNPSVFQGEMVSEGEHGVFNIMRKLGMLAGEPEMMRIPVICSSSSWLRTTGGGLLETRFQLLDHVKTGQLLAETYDPFGRVLQSYHAPHDGIVIGMSANPLAIPGTRFCHLGVIGTLSQFVRRKKKSDAPGVPGSEGELS